MKTAERVECDRCGIKVRLRADDTYPPHGWTRRSVHHECTHGGKRYARHMGEFRVIERDQNGIGTKWLAQCRCGRAWTGAEYDEVERPWKEHCAAIPAGEQDTRGGTE